MNQIVSKVSSEIRENKNNFLDKDLRVKIFLTKKLGKQFTHGKGKRKKKKK